MQGQQSRPTHSQIHALVCQCSTVLKFHMFPSHHRHDPTLPLSFYQSLSNSISSPFLLKPQLFTSSSSSQSTQSMEQVDQPAENHYRNNNNHYADATPSPTQQSLIHTTKPLNTLTTTASASYYPSLEQLDFHSNIHNSHQHHRSYLEAVDGVVGTTTTSTYLPVASGLFKSCCEGSEPGAAAFNYMSNNCSSRWPREETMSLLHVRSRLHSSFKQATHKGPLWDEVSRIMYEEHGYPRSGKKCREKFENLYKYYKKTKEAKSGKHDVKNYIFFRQLEALYGDQIEVDHVAGQPTIISPQTQFPHNSNNQVMTVRSSSHFLGNIDQEVSHNNQLNNQKLSCDQSCLSLSKLNSSSHFTSSSSEDYNKRSCQDKKKKKKLKMKIKEFIDIQMKSLIEQQQICMEKMMETIERKEKERVLREEELKQQAEERLEKEHKLWANERAWLKARDSALMDTLQKFTSARSVASLSHMRQVPAFSSSSIHTSSLMNKKAAECSSVRDPLALYNNQESQDRWLAASNHHHHHDEINGFRSMMSDGNGNGNGNVGYGGSLLWDGSSFGSKLNNGDHENHQN